MSTISEPTHVSLEAVSRLKRDIAFAVSELSIGEIRFLVDAYYTIQGYRIQAKNQVAALDKSGEPNAVLHWLFDQHETMEGQVKRALDKWTDTHPVGRWCKSITGVGPVLTAGLLAHIDIAKAPTAGHIWRFAGLDPTSKWEKGQKRPWNATLKTIVAFKLGECFVKVQNNKSDFYGRLFAERKRIEWEHNLKGDLREQAAAALAVKRFGADTEAKRWYSGQIDPEVVRVFMAEGEPLFKIPGAVDEEDGVPMLPPAHIHARARRWTVKLFLAHLQQVWWFLEFGEPAARPYVIEHMGHVDMIEPPNFPAKPARTGAA